MSPIEQIERELARANDGLWARVRDWGRSVEGSSAASCLEGMPRPLAANDSDRSALCALVHHCRDRHESALRKAVAALAEISDVGLPHDFNHDNAIAALAEIAQILTGETP